jgi:hypothetical protein
MLENIFPAGGASNLERVQSGTTCPRDVTVLVRSLEFALR